MWILLVVVLVVIGLIFYTSRAAQHDPVSAAWLQQRVDALAPELAVTVVVDPSPEPLLWAALGPQGHRLVVVYSGFLRAMGADLPALELALATELAHHRLGHASAVQVPLALADPEFLALQPRCRGPHWPPQQEAISSPASGLRDERGRALASAVHQLGCANGDVLAFQARRDQLLTDRPLGRRWQQRLLGRDADATMPTSS